MLSAPPGSSSLVPESSTAVTAVSSAGVTAVSSSPGVSQAVGSGREHQFFLQQQYEAGLYGGGIGHPATAPPLLHPTTAPSFLPPGTTAPPPHMPAATIKKSASDGQVMPLDPVPLRKSSHPSTESEIAEARRSSDGAISLMENSNDDDPCSPVALGATDWTEAAVSTAHIFVPTGTSVQACYLGQECLHSGLKYKCVACRIIAHQGCISLLHSLFPCKQTFRECVRKYREQSTVEHHWVRRKQMKGKCHYCNKHFQSKLGSKFGNTGGSAGLNCSWCKAAYHDTDQCRTAIQHNPVCDLGLYSGVIIPPSWIIKLPRKGSFKSSLKNSPKRCGIVGGESSSHRIESWAGTNQKPSSCHRAVTKVPKEHPTFILKPIPVANCSPVIVFLNPKSGGNQGGKLMQKFQWLLNPRQVFDLSQGGPLPAIELYKRVPGVRLLACGGDGTVGWVLSVLDQAGLEGGSSAWPPVGVLPLGTGNDLSRSLGWGGGYTDEPISKILMSLQAAEVINMDRWRLKFSSNSDYPPSDKGIDKLPSDVVNNYFSLGVDAQIALQFHEAREANPQKFNSRIRNKIFYTQAGSKDLILRKWKTLTDYITIECDGRDITPKLKELKVHSVMFLNIQSYSSGTRPWNRQFGEQKLDDGLLEVIGVTTYQLPLLQAGGHGHCITQCERARITTKKTIPMQVDGEATRVNPAIIEISFLNHAKMLAKRKSGNKDSSEGLQSAQLRIGVSKICMCDYEMYYCYKDQLKEMAKPFGEIKVDSYADLEQVRHIVTKLQENNIGPGHQRLSPDFCFLDSVTAERFFRIDRAQENLHFLIDICESCLYILETEESLEVQSSLAISSLCAEDLVTPPRSPLTPSPGSQGYFPTPAAAAAAAAAGVASGPVTNQPEQHLPLSDAININNNNRLGGRRLPPTAEETGEENGDLEIRSECRQPHDAEMPTFGLTPPDDDGLKTTDGILKAARLGDLKMLTELCNEGYSLLSTDETGKTGLHYGARFGHKEIIKFLLLRGPSSLIDMVDHEKGHTALHKAAAYKRRTICCMLVTGGANLSIQDLSGKTAQQLAHAAEDTDLSAYLESQEIFQSSSKDFETQV